MKKLREYKGVTYHSGGWWANGYQYKGSRAASAIISYRSHELTDDDHPELMRLKAEPYEPVPRLEDVVYGWLREEIECRIGGALPPINHWRLIERLRAAFPHIDKDDE